MYDGAAMTVRLIAGSCNDADNDSAGGANMAGAEIVRIRGDDGKISIVAALQMANKPSKKKSLRIMISVCEIANQNIYLLVFNR